MPEQIKYTIDIRTISEANARGHWAKHHPLHKQQIALAGIMTRRAMGRLPLTHAMHQPNAPINITMTRCANKQMDSGNLGVSMKYIQDGIADALEPGLPPGHADGLPRFAWTYRQKKLKSNNSYIAVTLAKYKPRAYVPAIATKNLFLPPKTIGSFGGPWDGD